MFLASFMFLASSAFGQDESYHILVTNDDGIESPGIQVLADHLRGVGQVHVVAPCGEQSGSSMSVALRAELHLRPVQRDGKPLEYCVDTSPAGAALLAIRNLAPEGGFDLVVSGINRGANVGTAAHMSGTVGAAMMGAFHGIPAVAASTSARADFEYSAQVVTRFVEELKGRPAMPGVVFSINVPKATEAETKGLVVAKMGGFYLDIAFEEQQGGQDGRHFRPRIGLRQSGFPDKSDTEAFMRDMITITPLLFDWTGYALVDELKGWGLSHKVGPRH